MDRIGTTEMGNIGLSDAKEKEAFVTMHPQIEMVKKVCREWAQKRQLEKCCLSEQALEKLIHRICPSLPVKDAGVILAGYWGYKANQDGNVLEDIRLMDREDRKIDLESFLDFLSTQLNPTVQSVARNIWIENYINGQSKQSDQEETSKSSGAENRPAGVRTKTFDGSGKKGDPLSALSVEYLGTRLRDVLAVQPEGDQKVYDVEHLIRKHGEHAVCPRDGMLGTAFVDVADDPHAGRATHFMSYCWGNRVNDIVNALQSHCDRLQLEHKDVRVWLCCLCVNQHRVKSASATGGTVTFEEFQHAFGSCVQSIRKVIALLSPWQKPLYITRMWCVFELFIASSHDDVELDLILPPNEESNFLKALEQDGMSAVWSAVKCMRVQDATASVEEDRKRILQIVRDGPGYAKLNEEVVNRIQSWFLKAASNQAGKLLGDSEDARKLCGHTVLGEHIAENCSQVLEYQVELAQYGEALRLGKLCLHCIASSSSSSSSDPQDALASQRMSRAKCQIQMLMGVAYHHQGDYVAASEHFKDSWDMYESMGMQATTDAARCLWCMGRLHVRRGKRDAALEVYRSALDAYQASNAGKTPEAAKCLTSIGEVHSKQGRFADALECYRQAEEIYHAAGVHELPHAASCLKSIGSVHQKRGDFDKALEFYQRAREQYNAAGAGQTPDAATCCRSIGAVHMKKGENELALKHYQEALNVLEQIGSAQTPGAATCLTSMGLMHSKNGNTSEADEFLNKALSVYKAVGALTTSGAGFCLMCMGEMQQKKGDLQSALEYNQRAFDAYAGAGAQDTPDAAGCLTALGKLYSKQGDLCKAQDYFKKAQAIYEDKGAEKSVGAAACFSASGSLHQKEGRWQEALEQYFKAYQIHKAVGAENTNETAMCLRSIGAVHFKLEDYKKALEYYQNARRTYEACGAGATSGAATCLAFVGQTYCAQGLPMQGLECLEAALKAYETIGASQTPGAAGCLVFIGTAHRQSGDTKTALTYFQRALDIYEAVGAGASGHAKDCHKQIEQLSKDMSSSDKMPLEQPETSPQTRLRSSLFSDDPLESTQSMESVLPEVLQGALEEGNDTSHEEFKSLVPSGDSWLRRACTVGDTVPATIPEKLSADKFSTC